jgi:hypothetical protein
MRLWIVGFGIAFALECRPQSKMLTAAHLFQGTALGKPSFDSYACWLLSARFDIKTRP